MRSQAFQILIKRGLLTTRDFIQPNLVYSPFTPTYFILVSTQKLSLCCTVYEDFHPCLFLQVVQQHYCYSLLFSFQHGFVDFQQQC